METLHSIVLWIHPNWLVASLSILFGVSFGLALAFSNWRSKLTISGVIASATGLIPSLTPDKFEVVKGVVAETALLTPVLVALNLTFFIFLGTVIGSASIVFLTNYVTCKKAADPESFLKASRRAFTLFEGGVITYLMSNPDQLAMNRIRDLGVKTDILNVMFKTMAGEVIKNAPGAQHFRDVTEATGRVILQTTFGLGPDLGGYRMAVFLLDTNKEKLEYAVSINNRDWTQHSGIGFNVSECFAGQALKQDKVLVYPRDKARKMPYVLRESTKYRSILAIPIPCTQGRDKHIGVITVDYTGKHDVFTPDRVEILFNFSQWVYAFHRLNVVEGRTL
jgi:hypothetical protein